MKAPLTCWAAQLLQTLTSAWNCSKGRPCPGSTRTLGPRGAVAQPASTAAPTAVAATVSHGRIRRLLAQSDEAPRDPIRGEEMTDLRRKRPRERPRPTCPAGRGQAPRARRCLLYTSDAADERSSVDLG